MGINPAMLAQAPLTATALGQQQARLAQQAQQEHLSKERQAMEKAAALLRARLGEQEWRLFERTSTLAVPSRLWPGTFYRLRPTEAVMVVRDGRVTASLCVLTTGGEPWPDRLMTILDLIASDERRLWQMANITPNSTPLDLLNEIEPWRDPAFYGFIVGVLLAASSVGWWLKWLLF